MTKDAMIKILEYLLECNYVDSFEDYEKEALRLAIKTLKELKGDKDETNN